MEFWIALPNGGPAGNSHLSIPFISEVARAAEELGFDGVFVKDHLVPPRDPHHAELHGRIFEAVVTLAYLAGQIHRAKLGTSIVVAPMRNPIVLAKQMATIDLISDGRLVIGLGVGYVPSEFEAVGADFHSRGIYTDESIRLIRHLFSGSSDPFHGNYFHLEDYSFEPLPKQGNLIPILIGGDSIAALRRAASLGDIWQSSAMDVKAYRTAVLKLRDMARNRHIRASAVVRMGLDARATELTGHGEELVDQVREWQDAGCELPSIGFGPIEFFMPKMFDFARNVIPAFRQ